MKLDSATLLKLVTRFNATDMPGVIAVGDASSGAFIYTTSKKQATKVQELVNAEFGDFVDSIAVKSIGKVRPAS